VGHWKGVWYWNLIGTVVSFGKFVTETITMKNGNVLLIRVAQLPADLIPRSKEDCSALPI
jgi:hypothetical protein